MLYSTSHKVIQHLIVSHAYTVTDRYRQTLSLTLNDSITNRLSILVYMCVLARQTSRRKPSAQRHSNIPYKALVLPPGRLQISWLARYARQLATNGVGRGPAVDMRTFRDYTLCKWLRTRLRDHPCAAAARLVITTNENRDIPQTTPRAISLCTCHATRSLLDRWQPITDQKYTSK